MNTAGSNSSKMEIGSEERPQLQTIDLAERRADEFVIDPVGAIGFGVSKTAEIPRPYPGAGIQLFQPSEDRASVVI
jgi:hypothetical protein